jgi:hypothetical protein
LPGVHSISAISKGIFHIFKSACGSKQFGLKSGVRHYVMRLEMKRAHHNGFERVGIDLDQLLSQADA